jgi:hypothetical protein
VKRLLPKIDCVRWAGNDLADARGWSIGFLWLGFLFELDFGRAKP